MDYKRIASDIIKNVGGKENIKSMTHCFTRLRFVLKDNKKADKSVVERLEGVISVVIAGGQFQVVLGNKVSKIHDAAVELLGEEIVESSDTGNISAEKQKIGNMIIQKLGEIFTPLVPAIAAAGLIKGLLAAAAKIPGFDTTASTYVIMNTASNIIFYFMPIFLAFTTAKALKCSTIIAMMLGGFICHPVIDSIVQDVATKSSIFGLPVIKMAFTVGESSKVFAYTESVIPIILGVIVLSFLEKFLKKYVPEILQLILVPGLSLIVMIPVMLVVVGPVGIYVGYIVQFLYTALYGFSPILGGIIVGGLWGICVIFGAHRALLPIGLNDVALSGTNTLMCFAGSANFAQAGAALGVMFKTKSANLKQVSASAALSAWLVGVTEPAVYGCNLRLKKPMICAVIAGAVGGAIMGIGRAVNTGFANNGILTIMSYWGEGTSFGQFVAYILGICVAFFGSAVLTYIVGFEDDPVATSVQVQSADATSTTLVTEVSGDAVIVSPVKGNAIALSQVDDRVFSEGIIGQGYGVIPTEGKIVAPADCQIKLIHNTNHAVGLLTDDGIELLIHVGIDTVKLNGTHFTRVAKDGTHVTKGTTLLTFDIDEIKAAGYDTTVVIIVTNSDDYSEIRTITTGQADSSKNALAVVR